MRYSTFVFVTFFTKLAGVAFEAACLFFRIVRRTKLTLSPAHCVHHDIVLMDLVLVMFKLFAQALQLLVRELSRSLGLKIERITYKLKISLKNESLGREI